MKNIIKKISARQILDSRGNPTVEATVEAENGVIGVAQVPSGASKGKLEALELRDNTPHFFGGKSVLKAVQNVNDCINKLLCGADVFEQFENDYAMLNADGTDEKSKFGANAILSVSSAMAKCAANSLNIPLYKYFGGINSHILPVPMINILNGGVHADNELGIQEFMIMPLRFNTFEEAIAASYEVFNSLKSILKKEGLSTSVGDEGGFAPELENTEQAIIAIMNAIESAGYNFEQIKIALDCAASEFWQDGVYEFENNEFTSVEMAEYLSDLTNKYPIYSIEDGMASDDTAGWLSLSEKLKDKVMLVGDDLMVTNPVLIEKFALMNIANSVLIKPNQIGTISETIMAIETARNFNYKTIVSHRSGDTCDSMIADLAVGLNSCFIKTGSLTRAERTSKYNRLLQIENMLQAHAKYY